ncbi:MULTISPECIES: hypothetical protein [unclassified Streptomyces]|uniref:hypothetical protein n=1 Tax=unclassified Streptomyces TaxID=2593676 RepID=UPI00278C7CE4|nr:MULTISPECIES: hypothetical protein [unclassified Streptomyces]
MSSPEIVTQDNFAKAETAKYFLEQLEKAPVNEFLHNRTPVNMDNQMIIRSNVDLLYSYAVVDVTEQATFSVAASEEFQVSEIIDENHYVAGVVYPGESLTLRNADLTTGTHVYILARTSLASGVERACELQDLRRIEAATANPYVPTVYDTESLDSVRAELETHSAEADFSKAFGTPETTDPYQHTLGAALGWGGLPPQDAQYYQAMATSTGCDAWTFDVPPLDYEHNGYFSVIKYDENGWLDVAKPGLTDSEMVRDADGRITVWFGDKRCEGKPNVIEATEGQRFYHGIRLYRPVNVDETRAYIDDLGGNPLRPVTS